MTATGEPVEISAATIGPARMWRPALAAVSGSVMVGFMPIITLQLYKAGISAPSMLVWRYGLALVLLTAASAAARHGFGAALRGGAWRIALVGATLGAGQTLCFWESLHTLDTSIAILLFYTYPALTLALDRLIFKRRIGLRAALCVAMILAGAATDRLAGAARRRPRPARARMDLAVAGDLRALSRRQFGADAASPATDRRGFPLSRAGSNVCRGEPLSRPRRPVLAGHLAPDR